MKILFISPHPGFGGASSANMNMATMLGMLGHDIVYLNEYDREKIPSDYYRLDVFPIHRNKFLRRKRTRDYVEAFNPEVIIVGVPIIGFYYLTLLSRLKKEGVRIIYVFHSLSLSNGMAGRFDELIITKAIAAATDLLFVSEYTRKSWERYKAFRDMHNRSYVIYNAIKQNKLTKVPKESYNKISFVGRASAEKDPVLFCEAALAATRERLPFVFSLWGDGPLLNELKNKYGNVVLFKGYEKNQSTIYEDTDILVMTSQFENCPMAILEAASYGIPCVVPNVGGIPEIVNNGRNGVIYNSRDINDVITSIKSLVKDYPLFSHNAYEESLKYSFESIKSKWDEILKV